MTVDLKNPFTSGLTITNINSTVMSHGLNLGTIQAATNFPASGLSTTTSPVLELNLNFDHPTLFTLLRRLAVQAGEATDQIDQIVALGGIQYVPSTDADGAKLPHKRHGRRHGRRANIFTCVYSYPSYFRSDAAVGGSISRALLTRRSSNFRLTSF